MKMVVQKISDLIEASGYTAETVEQMTGLPKGRISKWKGGTGEPTATQALRIARLLKVSLETLCDDELNVTADQHGARLRVVEIAQQLGWESVWLRLIGANAPAEPMKPGDVVGRVPRRERSTGG